MSTLINFNGKEYTSLEEMPPEVRRAYEQVTGLLVDRDGNGNPDLLQEGSGSNTLTVQQTRFVYDGKIYSSLEEMPPEVRRAYQEAMRRFGDNDRDGIPDVGGHSEALAGPEETRHIVVRPATDVRLDGLTLRASWKALRSSVGTSFLLSLLAALMALVAVIVWKML